jgi:hypothetical protein
MASGWPRENTGEASDQRLVMLARAIGADCMGSRLLALGACCETQCFPGSVPRCRRFR